MADLNLTQGKHRLAITHDFVMKLIGTEAITPEDIRKNGIFFNGEYNPRFEFDRVSSSSSFYIKATSISYMITEDVLKLMNEAYAYVKTEAAKSQKYGSLTIDWTTGVITGRLQQILGHIYLNSSGWHMDIRKEYAGNYNISMEHIDSINQMMNDAGAKFVR